MRAIRILVLLLFACAVLGGRLVCQDGWRRWVPEKFERATVKDENGIQTWGEWKGEKCPTCAGTGKAKCTVCEKFGEESTNCPDCHQNEKRETVCRTCGGGGSMPDPLEKAQCPACMAAGFLLCLVCTGTGHMRINGAKQWSECPACRGEGGFKCTVCNGERLVEVCTLKPSLKDADTKSLKKALGPVEQALTELSTFTAAGGNTARKEVKALQKIFDGIKDSAPMKKVSKQLGDYLGKTYGGANFQGHEQCEANAIGMVKGAAEYNLKHQKRMLELCIKRAEANELASGKSK